MKAIFKVLAGAALTTAATSCSSFLDINNNPNNQTSVTPDSQLASALVTTAANYTGGVNAGTNYNSYASFAAGYWGKSGTVSGFSEERTYNYSTTYYQNLWNATYDNLEDYQQIQSSGAGAGNYPYHAAIARIMKVYNFLLLVDEYGDIPYSQALRGLGNVAPTYDKQADIYKDFIVQLKGAVADINATDAAKTATFTPRTVGPEDVVFQGNMTRWKQFANSLRLRILLRESSTSDAALNSYVATEMTALQSSATDGYITTDVIVQPGFAANTGQQNPFYNRYGVAAGATRFNAEYSYIVPTKYIIRQYLSNSDARISQLYTVGTVDSVAAYSGTDLGEANPPQFDPTTRRVGSRFLNGGAFLKSATAPTVLMLLSEHLFSKAEAESRGLLAGGDAQQDYLDGIKASFITTYRAATTTPIALAAATTTTGGVTQYNAYIAANTTNGLVDWASATTTVPDGRGSSVPRAVSKTDKILYQKYLAENTLASTEAWDDYRRTAQPKFMVSLQSASPRTDKLATRLLYPQTEVSTNNANIPTGVTQFTKLFWDVID